MVVMYIESVPNRDSPPCILLRESFRVEGKVRKRTLANLTNWPPDLVSNFRLLLKGGHVCPRGEDPFTIERSLPHGHVAAVLGVARKLKLGSLLAARPSPERQQALALILSRVLDPRSKLSTARSLNESTASTSLAWELDLGAVDEDQLYRSLDWLLRQQRRVEARLARRHLGEGELVLFDLTSSYFEGNHCPLAKRGYSRDGKPQQQQIVFGLLCNPQGCPVAVEVFSGNQADPTTLGSQLEKLRERFALRQVTVVGDRGLLTQARIREEIQPRGLDWISALRAPQIRKLAREGNLQLSLFDERDLAEISSPLFPGERLVVCRNPLLADRRARKREELLQATEARLQPVVAATRRAKRPLKGKEKIGLRVGKILDRYKVGKHFDLEITEDSLSFRRRQDRIAEEAALDGLYVIRTSLSAERMEASRVVRSYKGLSVLEQAFRSFKMTHLKVRPIFHRLEDRVRAHVFLCMLAYYLQWHLRQRLAPLLFDEEDPEAAEKERSSVVAPARRSPQTRQKVSRRQNSEGFPIQSLRDLLQDLGTICKNKVRPNLPDAPAFYQVTCPTSLQQRALDLLEVKL